MLGLKNIKRKISATDKNVAYKVVNPKVYMSEDKLGHIKSFLNKGYDNALLMSNLPDLEWQETMERFTYMHDGAFGEYERTTARWGCFMDKDKVWMFMKSKNDYNRIINELPELIIDESPLENM